MIRLTIAVGVLCVFGVVAYVIAVLLSERFNKKKNKNNNSQSKTKNDEPI